MGAKREGHFRSPLVNGGQLSRLPQQTRKPTLARKRGLGCFRHRFLLHAGDVLGGLFRDAFTHSLNDALLADTPEVARRSRLPVGRHIEPEFMRQRGGMGLGCLATATTNANRVSGPRDGIDPNLFTKPVIYTNVLTGEATKFTIEKLPLGFSRVEPGKFYFNYFPLAYYYCTDVIGDTIHWHVVETFQNAQLVTGSVRQHIKYAKFYIPVADKTILKRLEGRLADYKKRARLT